MPQTIAPLPVSVVIPARNAERFIRQSIESVFTQTARVAELIVVADDCADETGNIAASLGAKVVESKAGNISAARNAGVRAAWQKWIAFLDADDFWALNKIELQWKAIATFPEAAVISCDYYLVYEGEPIGPTEKFLRVRHENVGSSAVITEPGTYFSKVDGRVLRWFEIAPQSAMVRRDVFERSGFFDEEFVFLQDIEFFARALRDNSLVMVEEPLVYRRMRPDSHSADSQGKWTAYFTIVDRMLRQPERYAPGAGTQYREHLKFVFASNERVLAQKQERENAERETQQASAEIDQVSKPNQW